MRILLFLAILSACGCAELTRPTGISPASSAAPGVPVANPTTVVPSGGH